MSALLQLIGHCHVDVIEIKAHQMFYNCGTVFSKLLLNDDPAFAFLHSTGVSYSCSQTGHRRTVAYKT